MQIQAGGVPGEVISSRPELRMRIPMKWEAWGASASSSQGLGDAVPAGENSAPRLTSWPPAATGPIPLLPSASLLLHLAPSLPLTHYGNWPLLHCNYHAAIL